MLILIQSALSLSCLGIIFGWSVISQLFVSLTGLEKQLIFGLAIGTTALGINLSTRLRRRYSRQLLTAVGFLMTGGGYLLAWLMPQHFFLLIASLGVITGLGIGMGYLGPIAAAVSVNPERRGLLSSVSITGFAVGALLPSMLFKFGVPAELFLAMLSMFTLIVGLPLAWLVTGKLSQEQQSHAISCSNRPTPMRLYVGFALTASVALYLAGNLKEILLLNNISVGKLSLCLAAYMLANALTRPLWGLLHDHLQIKALALSHIIFAMSLVALICVPAPAALPVILAVAGTCFGSMYVLYYAESLRLSESQYEAEIRYGYLFYGYGFGALVGPTAGVWLAEVTGTHKTPIIVMCILLSVLAILINLPNKKQTAAKS